MRVQARELPAWTAALVMLVVFAVGAVRYDHFASASNIANLLNDYAYVAVAALGATFVILLGGIDLSVGSAVAFTGVLMGLLIGHGWHPLGAAGACLVVGVVLGGVMGAIIQFFELPAFMVTLVGMFALRGAAFIVGSQSERIDHPFLVWASRHGQVDVGGVEIAWPLMCLVVGAAAAVMLAGWTPFGRWVYAVGGSERSARMMGAPIAGVRIGAYALAGLCSAGAGCMFAAGRQACDPSSGVGLELTVIAAVVIGGTLLSGGVGSVLGTVVGVLIIGMIRMIIDFEGELNAAWTSIATGALLLAFVVLQKLIGTLGLGRRLRYPQRD